MAALLLFGAAAWGHVISMSNGYATVSGSRVDYILRMPDYEVPGAVDPARLLDRIRFTSGFETAHRIEGECHHDARQANYLCAAAYVFSHPVAQLAVECRFFEVTVPNHIHMLHAERDGRTDQAILDSSLPTADLLFRPPTPFERAIVQALAAGRRTLTTWAQVLLLLALALASRTWRELVVCGLVFLLAEWAACLSAIASGWQPSARFSEAAVALAFAYLAFEMLVFPKSGGRWAIAALFGAFGGVYYASFVSEAAFSPVWVLAGSSAATLAALSVTVPTYKLHRSRTWIARLVSAPLLAGGVLWFVIRLRG